MGTGKEADEARGPRIADSESVGAPEAAIKMVIASAPRAGTRSRTR